MPAMQTPRSISDKQLMPSQASQLPHLIEFSFHYQVGCQAASALLLICFNHSGRLLGRRAVDLDLDLDLDLLLILILGAPLNHAGRTQVLRSG